MNYVPNVYTFETVIVFKGLETTVTNKNYTHEEFLFSSEYLIFSGYIKRGVFLDY